MAYLPTFMVNVGKYAIHGSYGYTHIFQYWDQSLAP